MRAALALSGALAFWYWSASPQGAGVAIQVGVICALFATRDNPLAAVRGFIKGAALAAALATLYRLVLLPGSDGFAELVLWLAPVYVLAGLAMARPATAGIGIPVTIFFPLLLDLSPLQNFDALPLFNNVLSLGMGMVLAVLAFMLVWPGDTPPRPVNGCVGIFAVPWDAGRSVAAGRAIVWNASSMTVSVCCCQT
ncbi:hypothetical protein HML84_03680 [Alcanivorax sp. IO_7]|nr:hypothetical protein HML84_03680 [Alcanivorax sp. IO_7]